MSETFRYCAATLTCVLLAVSAVFTQSHAGVVVAAAPVRLMPDASRVPLATLIPGTPVRLEEEAGEWYRVSFRDPHWGWRIGYVRADQVEAKSAEAQKRPAETATILPPPGIAQEVSENDPSQVADHSATAMRNSEMSKRAISESIALGRRQRDRTQGLALTDSARQFPAAFAGGDGTGMTLGTALRLQVFTPLAWIRQLAGEAKRDNRKFGMDDVSGDVSEQVLRVFVNVSGPNAGARPGTPGMPAVQEITLRDPSSGTIVQPTSKQPFHRDSADVTHEAPGGEGWLVKFPMEAIRELHAGADDREFVISVTSSNRETREFRVTKHDFDKLPGIR